MELINNELLYNNKVDAATRKLRKFSGDINDTLDGYCSPTGRLLLDRYPCVRFMSSRSLDFLDQAENLKTLAGLVIPGLSNSRAPSDKLMLMGCVMHQIKKLNQRPLKILLSDINRIGNNTMFGQHAHQRFNEFECVKLLKDMDIDTLKSLYQYYKDYLN